MEDNNEGKRAIKVMVIGCKLPQGIILEHPQDTENTVTLNGLNRALIIGADYATTEVDADFWGAWIDSNKDFPAVKSGAIFAAKNIASVASMAKEFEERKTGLEGMVPDDKSNGVVTADKE